MTLWSDITPRLRARREAAYSNYGQVIKSLIKPTDKMKSLDVGCGIGLWVGAFDKLGIDAWGIDLDKKNIEMARDRVPGGAFIHGDFLQLPTKEVKFDMVTAMGDVILYQKDLKEFCRKLAESAKPGGRVVIQKSMTLDSDLNDRLLRHDLLHHPGGETSIVIHRRTRVEETKAVDSFYVIDENEEMTVINQVAHLWKPSEIANEMERRGCEVAMWTTHEKLQSPFLVCTKA